MVKHKQESKCIFSKVWVPKVSPVKIFLYWQGKRYWAIGAYIVWLIHKWTLHCVQRGSRRLGFYELYTSFLDNRSHLVQSSHSEGHFAEKWSLAFLTNKSICTFFRHFIIKINNHCASRKNVTVYGLVERVGLTGRKTLQWSVKCTVVHCIGSICTLDMLQLVNFSFNKKKARMNFLLQWCDNEIFVVSCFGYK